MENSTLNYSLEQYLKFTQAYVAKTVRKSPASVNIIMPNKYNFYKIAVKHIKNNKDVEASG